MESLRFEVDITVYTKLMGICPAFKSLSTLSLETPVKNILNNHTQNGEVANKLPLLDSP